MFFIIALNVINSLENLEEYDGYWSWLNGMTTFYITVLQLTALNYNSWVDPSIQGTNSILLSSICEQINNN